MADLNQQVLMRKLFVDQEFTDLIIKLNTQFQLYDYGIDSDGKRLDTARNGYSYNTIHGTNEYQGKIDKGQPIDRITLKDTGAFYESFKCIWSTEDGGTIQIVANTIKGDDDLIQDWGKAIIGLTPESLAIVVDKARELIIQYVRSSIKEAA